MVTFKMKNVFIILFVFATLLIAQNNSEFPVLTLDDIPDAVIEKTEYYDGNSLWGLINGGADIYLEYGFERLGFQSVKWRDNSFRVEIYKMNSPAAAYGIFSVSRYKCDINDTLTKFICITKYQTQAAHGCYYISVANTKGTSEAGIITTELFSKIILKIEPLPFHLPDIFNNPALVPFTDKGKYINCSLGLQNGFPKWYDKFENYDGYNFFVIPCKLLPSHGL